MELLIPAAITLLTQGYKWILNKTDIDDVTMRALTLVMVFVLTLLGGTLWGFLEGTLKTWQDFMFIFSLAITYFELVVKRVLLPVFEAVKRKINYND